MNVQKSFKKGKRTLIGLLFLTLCSGCANAETIRIEEPVKHINSSNIVEKDTIKEKKVASKTEIEILAKTIYHESRGEPIKGQYAIAVVAMNRVKSEKFPHTVEGVVKQYGQFSWVLNKKIHKISDQESYLLAKEVAKNVIEENGTLYNEVKHKLKGSLYFNDKPFKKRTQVAKIGKHLFFI